MKIVIIGCGNMGLAFARSFVQYDLVKREDLLLIEKNEDRCSDLRLLKEGVVINTISTDIAAYDLVILAVKPQDYPIMALELQGKLKQEQVVLSIMAGIPIKKIQDSLSHQAVVRAMPNTPAMLGQGITGFTSAEGIG